MSLWNTKCSSVGRGNIEARGIPGNKKQVSKNVISMFKETKKSIDAIDSQRD